MKARYRQHWLEAVVAKWVDGGATGNFARYKPNLRDVLAWLLDAWMNISTRTIQRCWWRTECLPLAWALSLSHVGAAGLTPSGRGVAPLAIDLDGEIDEVSILIDRLGLGPSAMPAAEFVAIDNGQPTCVESGEDPLADEPASAYSAASWETPTSMEAVYNDDNPASREARRYARAACEMLIGYARATSITPRELCALFEIRNPIIIERMERASPPLNLNATSIATPRPSETPDAVRAPPRERVLPAWMTAPSPRQALIDAGAPAAMDGFIDAAEWAMGNGRPTVVEFYADWCQVCRETARDTLKVEQQFRNDVNFVFLNIDNVKWAAELDEFGVDGIPHYTFLDGEGNEMAYVVGKVPRRILLDNVSALAQGRPELPFSQFISEASDAALRQAPRVVDPRDHGP
ncbi:unnamed protein product [Closterium sp. NIES-65]|nr:unnamed protein product [Closterium sp. NIES-65]